MDDYQNYCVTQLYTVISTHICVFVCSYLESDGLFCVVGVFSPVCFEFTHSFIKTLNHS